MPILQKKILWALSFENWFAETLLHSAKHILTCCLPLFSWNLLIFFLFIVFLGLKDQGGRKGRGCLVCFPPGSPGEMLWYHSLLSRVSNSRCQAGNINMELPQQPPSLNYPEEKRGHLRSHLFPSALRKKKSTDMLYWHLSFPEESSGLNLGTLQPSALTIS